MKGSVAILLVAMAAGTARAEGPRLLDDDTFAVHSEGSLALDGALYVATPAQLPAGMSTGVAAGVTRGCGCLLAYGLRASWSQVTESSPVWSVTQWDMKLRASGALRHRAGRGTLSLRLSAGATVVREDRVRNQAMTAGLTGGAFETKAYALMPAGELEGVITLHVAGPWLAIVSAGPSLLVDPSGGVRGGFVAQMGVGWQP